MAGGFALRDGSHDAAIVMVLLGLSADRMREPRWHLIIPALLGAVGFVVSANAGSTTVAVVSSVVIVVVSVARRLVGLYQSSLGSIGRHPAAG